MVKRYTCETELDQYGYEKGVMNEWAHGKWVKLEDYRKLEGVNAEMYAMLQELDECADYWSEYDVPLGIQERLKNVLKKVRGGQ